MDKIFSRQEIYDLVWSTPMRTLAAEFGLSDVGLTKLCRRHRVPTPPRGYWARKQAGQEPPRAKLAVLDKPFLEKVVIQVREPRPETTGGEAEPTLEIVVTRDPASFHPLVEKTAGSLRAAKPGADGRARPRAQSALPIAVAPSSVERVLAIASALVVALESRGHIVEVTKDEKAQKFMVSVFGEKLDVVLEEDLDREVIELTERQKREKEKSPWLYRHPEYRYFPNGRLVFRIDREWSEGIRKRYADGARQRLEDLLGSAILALEALATKLQEDRRKREEEERRRREWEIERVGKLDLIAKEEEKLKKLDRQVDGWHRSQQIRAFLEAVRTEWIAVHGGIPYGSDVASWVEWASQQADRLDPLKTSPPSILDEKAKWTRGGYGW